MGYSTGVTARPRAGARLRPTVRTKGDRRAAVMSGAASLALGLVARHRPSRPERFVEAAVNHDTRGRPLLRLPQQLGTPWVLPLLSVTGLLTHRPHLAVSAACAVPLEKALEVTFKDVVHRTRPASADPRTVLHDDAPTEGGSYPSGHAALVTCAALLTASYLPEPVARVTIAAGAASAWIRVRQGAHFPLDVVGGGLLGVSVASTLRSVFGVPRIDFT